MIKNLSDTLFSNTFTSELPGDESYDVSQRFTPNVCYSLVHPTPAPQPKWIGFSTELANTLGVQAPPSEEDLKILSGIKTPDGSKPFALCYGGHQFGHWAGQLGDGRAITLGEIKASNSSRWEIQLKGAGLTPYSRTADGKAVLRSSVREFLASEAMYHLDVPTTRALALVLTGEPVLRDMFYNGNIEAEPGAIVTRVAPTFLRFGNFEILAAQKNKDLMERLLKWSVKNHFPELQEVSEKDLPKEWFKIISKRTAYLIAEWMRVGFVHGVMNTDNMSILGLTIDYGPYGWLEEYDPSWTPNTTDLPGRRYCFGRQASIGYWNLQCLASALHIMMDDKNAIEEGLNEYTNEFQRCFFEMMSNKLGLAPLNLEGDQEFLRDFDDLLQSLRADMTLFYRNLNSWDPRRKKEDLEKSLELLISSCYEVPDDKSLSRLKDWLERYSERIQNSAESLEQRVQRMNKNNPKYILRNYMAYQIAQEIEKEGNQSLFDEIFLLLKKPYEEQPEFVKWAQLRPEWAKEQPGSSTLSCSS